MITQIANRYTIISLIGQGGMADVYRATDMILSRDVAIKVLRSKLSDDPMILVRFQREASAASRLSHPNVVDIYDVGEYEGMHYIVMEYVKGPTLKQLIQRRGALDVLEAVFIMKQLTSAIANAHEHQIIHRDIKPQNILVKDDGTVKITDFGIAIAADAVQLTYNNAVMGSAHYLAPESAQGKEPDGRVDIYSLGIVFYELLTGNVPFRGKTPTEIAIKHLREPMPYVRDFNRQIPQSVENIVLKATAKDPDQRYSSAAEMLSDLQSCLLPQYRDVPRIAIKQTPLPVVEVEEGHVKVVDYEQPEKPVRKKKSSSRTAWISAITICVLCVLVLAVSFLSGWIRIPGLLGYETMPDVVDLTYEQAILKLEDAGFGDASIRSVEKVSDSVDAGDIISSSIAAGKVIKSDSDITLTVSKGPSYLISDYTGRSLDKVEEELREDGVNLQIDVTYQGAANTNPGIILEQNGLKPGDRIDPDAGETISFTVSQYPTITLDASLIGMDVSEAKDYLNSLGAAVMLVQSGYSGSNLVVDVWPPVGSEYTQEGTDSVVTLYYD